MSQANFNANGIHRGVYEMCLDITEVLDQKARFFGLVGEFYFSHFEVWSLYFRLRMNRNSNCYFFMDLEDPRQALTDEVFQAFADEVLDYASSKPVIRGVVLPQGLKSPWSTDKRLSLLDMSLIPAAFG